MTQVMPQPTRTEASTTKMPASGEQWFLGGSAALSVVLFLFLGFSRLSDILFPGPPIIRVLSLAALVIVVLNGAILHAVSSRAGIMLLLFFGWACLASPFGIWPGGSFHIVKEELVRSVLAFFIVAASLTRISHVQWAMVASGLGTSVAALLAFHHDVRMVGRLILPIGMYGNPNDFASALLIGTPLIWCILGARARIIAWLTVLVAVATGLNLFAVTMTGSRGAFLALAVMTVTLFLVSRFPVRALLLVLSVIGLVSAPAWLPESVMVRFGAGAEQDLGDDTALQRERQKRASGSARQRSELLKQSLILTARNPFLGVGPGNFPPAAAELSREFGERPLWKVSHNTYTEISSEAGIPALLFFAGMIIASVRSIAAAGRLASRSHVVVGRLSLALLLALVGLLVSAFFGSLGYSWLFPVLAGLSVALARAARSEIGQSPTRT